MPHYRIALGVLTMPGTRYSAQRDAICHYQPIFCQELKHQEVEDGTHLKILALRGFGRDY